MMKHWKELRTKPENAPNINSVRNTAGSTWFVDTKHLPRNHKGKCVREVPISAAHILSCTRSHTYVEIILQLLSYHSLIRELSFIRHIYSREIISQLLNYHSLIRELSVILHIYST